MTKWYLRQGQQYVQNRGSGNHVTVWLVENPKHATDFSSEEQALRVATYLVKEFPATISYLEAVKLTIS
jgi:hypothetical protein